MIHSHIIVGKPSKRLWQSVATSRYLRNRFRPATLRGSILQRGEATIRTYKDCERLLQVPDILLVGGWKTPLKNMKFKWDYCSQYIYIYRKLKFMFQTTNQFCDYIPSGNLLHNYGKSRFSSWMLKWKMLDLSIVM